MFSLGDRVRLKNDPSRAGEITGSTKELAGKRYHGVRMADGSGEQMLPERQLEMQSTETDALKDLRDGRLSPPDAMRRLLTHIRLTGRLSDMIYSMEATNTDFHAYQFKPVVKLLNSPTRGLLIADEVGLGKTIEAGLVWTELVARLDVSRLLVVCPKSLTEKWRLELRQKFGVFAKIVGAKELRQALERDAEDPEGFALICSLPSVRPPRGWDEEEHDSERAKLARYLSDQAGDRTLVDLTIFDEAHHLRNSETMGHTFATLAMDVSDYKLLLSATPINLHSEDLRSLLRLLDPDTFDNSYMFSLVEQENLPLVAAREKALNPSTKFAELLEIIRAIPRGEVLRIDQQLEILQRQLSQPDLDDTQKVRAGIAAHLEEMSLLGSIVNRTRRRDVNELKVTRRVHSHPWTMTDDERAFYDEASNVVRQHAFELSASERFLLATPQRLIASSLPAAFRHWASKSPTFSSDDPDIDEGAAGPLVSKLALICRDPDRLEALEQQDTKLERLLTALEQTWSRSSDEKIIVFSSFRRTIDYLAERLVNQGIKVEAMHGSTKDDRQSILKRFEEAAGRTVLLTSEVGGEGLDLQFCRTMINYDLPWNPMKVEQRIGRIDRIGQRAESIEVVSLVCSNTIEEQIYDRLYNRILHIEATLGSFESILGAEMADLERRLLDPKLSETERAEEVERAAMAIENRYRQQEALEKEAPGLIAHGDMIMARIHDNHRPERRVQGRELADYVGDAIQGRFPGSRVDPVPGEPELYDVSLTATAQFEMVEFLRRSGNKYPTLLRREQKLRMAFSKLDLPRQAEVVTNVHPLVRFAAHIREDAAAGVPLRPASSIVVDRGSNTSLPPGEYVCAVQSWTAEGVLRNDRAVFSACHIANGDPLSEEDAEMLLRAALNEGKLSYETTTDVAQAAAVSARLIQGDLERRFDDFVAEEFARHEDRSNTGLAQLKRYRQKKVTEVQDRLREWRAAGDPKRRNLIKAEEAKLEKFLARVDHKIREQEAKSECFRYSKDTRAIAMVTVTN